jgi:hypothetical protein
MERIYDSAPVQRMVMDKCQDCQKPLDKKQKTVYLTPDKPKPRKDDVCIDCLFTRLGNNLQTSEFRAVVVYPTNKMGKLSANSYYFMTSDELIQYNWTLDFVDDVEAVMPTAGTACQKCGAPARYAWCSPDICFNDMYSQRLNSAGKYEKEDLCAQCLVKEFAAKMKEGNLSFWEFGAPSSADTFGTVQQT